jgi:hypothetical protein
VISRADAHHRHMRSPNCRHEGYHSYGLRIDVAAQRLERERVCDDCGEVLERAAGDRYAPAFIPDGRP